MINGASQAVEGSITVPAEPRYIAVDPATDTVYADSSSGLTVINGATDEVITTITSVAGQVAVDPATNTVYAPTELANNLWGVAVIDGATNLVTTTVALGSTTGYISLAVDAKTDTIYAATLNGTVSAIDGATDAVTQSVQLGPGVYIPGIAVDPATASVYVADNRNGTVDVLNAATLASTASITGCPHHIWGVAADPTANVIFVSSYGVAWPSPADSTCVIDAATNAIAETFPRGGSAVAADPATGAAYIVAWNPYGNIWVATPSATDELSPVVYGFFPLAAVQEAAFAVGIESSFPLVISALPAATVTETGALPQGVTMSASGVFSGTAAAGTVGTYPITVTASNGISPDSTMSFSIVVGIEPTITSPASTTFQTGVPGSFTVQATGNPAPTVTAARYPSWMTFTPGNSSGVLSGTPPPGSGGIYSVEIQALSGEFGTNQTLTLTVNQPPAVAVASHLTFRAGHHVRYLITSTGFPLPVLSEHGLLPRGLAFEVLPEGQAFIVGKPALRDKGKRYLITITASNHIGQPVTKNVTIRIK